VVLSVTFSSLVCKVNKQPAKEAPCYTRQPYYSSSSLKVWKTMFDLDEDGTRPPIRLPNEILLFVAKSLDDRDCVALALSGAFEGFASLYDAER